MHLCALSCIYIEIPCVESLALHVRAKRCSRQTFLAHGSDRILAHVPRAVKLSFDFIIILHLVSEKYAVEEVNGAEKLKCSYEKYTN